MSTSPDRQSATRISRERFLSDPGAEDPRLVPGPRPDIVTSWRRSQLVGVSPDGVDLPYSPPPQMPRRLLAAAGPIIDALEQELRDTSGTVLLADREVRILDRRTGSRSWLRSLDRSNIAPGFLFAEEYAGTNGLGCAMEERRLFEVRGAEHFRERFQSLVCIAAPIRHPARNAVVGALNLTCSVDDFSPLARTVLRRAVSDIERRLLDASSPHEQELLAQYTARSRRVGRPLIAVSADMLVCNPAASAVLERTDRELLWHWAGAALGAAESATEHLVLASGQTVVAHATPVAAGHRLVGALIELYAVEQPGAQRPAVVPDTPRTPLATAVPAQPGAVPRPAAHAAGPRNPGPGSRGAGAGSRDTTPGAPSARLDGPEAAHGSGDTAPGWRDTAPGSRDTAPGPRDSAPGPRDSAPGWRDSA
ncbi:GAF domain-containing protein, partial [Cumulibacter manganitolerans]|uniref:GAF domain-containing protein n=1 Tax=Cumulibacter manganitolerans TaxID=1884992 RepID=UPI001E5C0323